MFFPSMTTFLQLGVGEKLKSEHHELPNKIFCCKLADKTLKEHLECQERPANCEAAKTSRVNPGIWRKLKETTKRQNLQFFKIQQSLIKGILPVIRMTDKLLSAKSLDSAECQDLKKHGLEAMSLLTMHPMKSTYNITYS